MLPPHKTTMSKQTGRKTAPAKKAAPAVTISPFETEDILNVVFSAPNLAITAQEALKLLQIKAGAGLSFFNELPTPGAVQRSSEFSEYKEGQLTTVRAPVMARKYEKIVEAADAMPDREYKPQFGSLGFKIPADLADKVSKQVSEILGHKLLYYPILGEGIAEYDGFKILYRVYSVLPPSIWQRIAQLDDLTEASKLWRRSENKKAVKDAIQERFGEIWPDYSHRGNPILAYLDIIQANAEEMGADQGWTPPMYYDLETDQIVSSLSDWKEGGFKQVYEVLEEYKSGDRLIVLYGQ